MTMSETQETGSSPSTETKASGGSRRRRGRRGGRGRSRAPVGPAAATEAPPAAEPAALVERVTALKDKVAARPAPQGSAINQALDEVMQIVEALKRAADQMEEVLELVELAERQKLADEQEIEELRRTLRQLHRPRGRHASEQEGHGS